MAGQRNKPSDSGVVSRLAGRGEDAITRLMEELGKNTRVTEALAKAMSAKGKVDDRTRKTLGQFGLAASDEIKDLRTQLEKLEKRLAKLEAGGRTRATGRGRTGTAKRSETKRKPTAARRTRQAPEGATGETPAAPAPGRALGGGTARGGGASRGTPG